MDRWKFSYVGDGGSLDNDVVPIEVLVLRKNFKEIYGELPEGVTHVVHRLKHCSREMDALCVHVKGMLGVLTLEGCSDVQSVGRLVKIVAEGVTSENREEITSQLAEMEMLYGLRYVYLNPGFDKKWS